MQEITSLKDSRIQIAKSLNTAKGRASSKKFLIEGEEAVKWALEAGIEIDFLLVSNKHTEINNRYKKLDVYCVSEGLLKKATGTNYVVPVVAIGNAKERDTESDFCIVLDNLQDFGNIGTIIRTCHAFGINHLISTTNNIDIFQKKVVDSSRGRCFSTALQIFNSPEETIKYLRDNGFQIVTTSPYGNSIQSLVELSDKPVALIVGNETTGASDLFMEQADLTVQIPMSAEVESLNVGVATGISIYELKLKKVLGMIEKKIKSTLGRDINVASMLIQEVLDKKLKKVSELSSTQLIFIMVLKCDAVMKVVEIQKQFGITDGEILSFLNLLDAKGYIRRNHQNDIEITETGVEIIGKLWPVIENSENEILSAFSEAEKKELKRLIDKLRHRCAEIIENP